MTQAIKTALAWGGAAITLVKDLYLGAVDWIARHPHWTFWLAFGGLALTVRV